MGFMSFTYEAGHTECLCHTLSHKKVATTGICISFIPNEPSFLLPLILPFFRFPVRSMLCFMSWITLFIYWMFWKSSDLFIFVFVAIQLSISCHLLIIENEAPTSLSLNTIICGKYKIGAISQTAISIS